MPNVLIAAADGGAGYQLIQVCGSLLILARDRVHLLDVPFTQAVKVISKWGAGAGELARGVSVRS